MKTPKEKEVVYNTMADAVTQIFFKEVIGIPVRKLKKNETLADLVPKKHKKFSDDFVKMYVDVVQRVFGVSIYHQMNQPVIKILKHIEDKKHLHSRYGQKR